MELTPGQLGAARACGCDFLPATEDQVRRLTMQRRIFRVGGVPFVAAREGFFETHGTLAALTERHRPGAATDRGVGADVPPTNEAGPTPAQVMADDPGMSAAALGAPTPAKSEVVRVERNVRREAAVKPRRPRAPRPKPQPATTDATPTGEAAPEPSGAEDMLAAVEATQDDAPKARAAGRRRAGQPTPPRWTVAGKMRRGRLK